ncbi:MAG: DUF2294 domain-containing protein [Prochloraceae cyanobacterium]
MNNSFTISQDLQNQISQIIKDIYSKELGHQVKEVKVKLRNSNLIIIVEGTVTKPEQLLSQTQNRKLAKQVRKFIDDVIQPQIKNSLEEAIEVKILDYLSDTVIDSNITGAIAILTLN